MEFFKSFYLILSLTVFIYTLVNTSHCNPDKGVKLLYRKQVFRPAYKGLAQDVYVAYPKDGDTTTKVEIVDFCVKDHDPIIFGAKPVFAYSVEDDTSRHLDKATIILRGLESRGINSTVEFYGFE